jgi:glycosyltransferase involved in cell wall biosynthesis
MCDCHTPMRFAWRTEDYFQREQLGAMQRAILSVILTYVRLWDVVTSTRVDAFIANSREVASRIRRYYGREAAIIPPYVNLPPFRPTPPEDFYLAGGRLIPYKRLDLAVRAFTALGLPLKIYGEGRHRAALEAMAGPNIEFLGYVSDETLQSLFARCRAFILPGEEDFAITPLEAMSGGRPVIAYGSGGVLDTVVEGVTGRFFCEPTAAALAAAVAASRYDTYDSLHIRRHAETFGRAVFRSRIEDFVQSSIGEPLLAPEYQMNGRPVTP